MDTSKPDARHFNLPNHCKPFRAVYSSLQPLPISRQLRKPHYSRTKIFLSNQHSQSPRYQWVLFIPLIYSCLLVAIFPPIA